MVRCDAVSVEFFKESGIQNLDGNRVFHGPGVYYRPKNQLKIRARSQSVALVALLVTLLVFWLRDTGSILDYFSKFVNS